MYALYPSVLFFNSEEGEPGNEEVAIGDEIGRDHLEKLGTSRE